MAGPLTNLVTNPTIGDISYSKAKQEVQGKLGNKNSVIIVDVGTGEGSVVKMTLDSKIGLVYEEFRHKIDRVKSAREFTNKLMDFLSQPELKDLHTIINLTSWARINPKGDNKRLVRVLQEAQDICANIIVKVLTQPQEAKLSEISLKHVLLFINPALRKLINPANTIQLEAGKGSTQSAALLPKQDVEKAASWAEEELKAGKGILEVVEIYKNDILRQMNPPEAIVGIKNLAMQGLFAVGLKDKEILKSLKIRTEAEEKDWNSGQITRSINDVIAACESKVTKADSNLKNALAAALNNSNIQNLIFGKEESKNEATEERDYATDVKAVKAYLKNDPKLEKVSDENEKKLLKDVSDSLSLPVPVALAGGMLKAVEEKCGDKLNVINEKEANQLFFDNGIPMDKEVKVSGTHGAAIKHFIKIGLVEKQVTSSWKPTGTVHYRREDTVRLKAVAPEVKSH